ncbi:MAG: FKBP-type peptidyl-prolyl cis-trans isomerase [Mucilaginibacter sp.]|nr:FKBP-type peptidyl-prolyl cis-trans isomerase [Mucilaginibacter sp.]
MKKNLMFLALAAIGLASCNGGFKKGNGGMLYDIHVDKGAARIKEGDFISLQLIAKTDGDSVLMSTYEQGHPILTLLQKPQTTGDIFAGVKLLGEGDSATIKTDIDSIIKKGMRRPPLKGKYIVYEVKIDKVIPKGKMADTAFNSAITAYLKGQADVLKKAEPAKIKKYIDANKLTMTTTASGLNYIITKQGAGDKPAAGDTVYVNYVGKFVTGKLFETNVKEVAQKEKTFNPMARYEPIPVVVGIKAVIPGWDEALMLLNKGAKATLVVPSNLAYGEQGNQIIQPFTPLVFDVELVKIVHPDPNAKKPVLPAPLTLQQLQQQAKQQQAPAKK